MKTKLEETVLRLLEIRGVPYWNLEDTEFACGDTKLELIAPPENVGGDPQNMLS